MLLFFVLFFFTHLSNMVTEHQTTDYRITYTQFFPKRRTNTAAARGQVGVSPVSSRTPPLLPQADKILLFFLLFFGKSKFVKSQNQTRIPSRMSLFPSGRTREPPPHDLLGQTCKPELASDIQKKKKKKN